MQPDTTEYTSHVSRIADAVEDAARGDTLEIALSLIIIAKCLGTITPALRTAVSLAMVRHARELDSDVTCPMELN
jgi:hypothetical protein